MEVDLPPAKNPASDFIKLPPQGWGLQAAFGGTNVHSHEPDNHVCHL